MGRLRSGLLITLALGVTTAACDDGAIGDQPGAGGDAAATDDAGATGDAGVPGASCVSPADCPANHFCACADPACASSVCNLVACTACTFTNGDGTCTAGDIAAGNDPNDACPGELTCNGSGACQLDLGQSCTSDAQCGAGHVCECTDADCATRQCSDCSASWGVLQCAPDACEGVKTDACGRTLDCGCAPRRIVDSLGDPEILKVSDDLFYLSGTLGGLKLPIYESVDLQSFTLVKTYDPSAVDPAYDYCFVWAPDLALRNGQYVIHFSAVRVPELQSCPSTGQQVTTFYAVATPPSLDFGAPLMITGTTGEPRSKLTDGCFADGCDKTIRIDAATFDEGGDTWFFYVWYSGGNNISSFRLSQPSLITHHTSPQEPFEGIINEAPEIFERDGKYFLLFSVDAFQLDYEMHYLVGDSVNDLTRARNLRRHSMAITKADGTLVENHGHNAVVERHGQFYNAFHAGSFNAQGIYDHRDTLIQRMMFKDDQAIHTLNSVNVRWQELAGYSYSFDIKPRGADWIGPCIGGLGQALSTNYAGMCRNDSMQRVHKSEIEKLRIFYSNDGSWTQYSEVDYDGFSDEVSIPIAGAVTTEVALSWSEKQTFAQYSLDVLGGDDEWRAPCVGAATLDRSISYLFDGTCSSAGETVSIPTVRQFRICSAVGGNWAQAVCGTSEPYDGKQQHVRVQIP